MNNHPINNFSNVLRNLQNASAEEISRQLDYYNADPVMIDGTAYHPFNDPVTAARLNARYHELTGQDHPRFISEAPRVINELMEKKQQLLEAGAYTPMYFDRLLQIKSNILENEKGLEFAEGHHPIQDFQRTLDNLQNASAEEISRQLDYYNADPVMIDGTAYHPYNDPVTAAQLDARYFTLTGHHHPRYLEQAPVVIEDLLNDKEKLLSYGAYSQNYFDQIENINDQLLSIKKPAEISTREELEGMKEQLERVRDIQNRDFNYNGDISTMSENNNMLSINNVEQQNANQINNVASQIDPVMYQQFQNNQMLMMQKEINEENLIEDYGDNLSRGFANNKILISFVLILCLLLILGIFILIK